MKFSSLLKIFICLALLSSIIFYGCSKSNNKSSKKDTPKTSEALKQIEKNIDQIITTLDTEGKVNESEKTQENKTSSNTQSGSPSGNSSKSDSSQGDNSQNSDQKSNNQSNSSNKSETGNQTQQKSPWADTDKMVKEIQKSWNQYQPQAVKDGAPADLVNNFENDLNTLTNDIAGMNIMNTLNNANNLYKYIPDFLSLYKDNSVDVKRVKYFIRDTMYKSRYDKWDLALASINSAKTLIPSISSETSDNSKQDYESLKYEISNLLTVTTARQKNLVIIKGNLALENINNIIKEIDKKGEEEQKSGK